jgi:hypothetical protein
MRHAVNRGVSLVASGHRPVLSRVEGSVELRSLVTRLAIGSRFPSQPAAPLQLAGVVKVQAHCPQPEGLAPRLLFDK